MRAVAKTIEYVSIALMILLTGVVLLQIGARYFKFSIAWTSELSIYSFIALAFLGGGYAYLKGEGFRITFLTDRLSPEVRRIVDIIVSIISIAIVLLVVTVSIKFMISIWGTPTTALRWNKALFYAAIPLGFSLVFIKLCKDLKNVIKMS